MTDPPVGACETCGGAVKKRLYPVGIQFKGSGFYVNDYAKSAPPSENNTSPDGSSSDGKGSGAAPTDTNTKPDTKSDAKSDTAASTPAKEPSGSTPAATTPP